MRFWSQSEREIDRSSLSPVVKFSYLKQFLEPKARSVIDGLPFTSEGYDRANSILAGKYGQSSEVANAHIQKILALPTINNNNPYKIHGFYERLVTHMTTLAKAKETT